MPFKSFCLIIYFSFEIFENDSLDEKITRDEDHNTLIFMKTFKTW